MKFPVNFPVSREFLCRIFGNPSGNSEPGEKH